MIFCWLPLSVAYGASLAVLAQRDSIVDGVDTPPPSVRTPNPQKAPVYFLSPVEVLVYVDPRWAGSVGSLLGFWSVMSPLLCACTALRPNLTGLGLSWVVIPLLSGVIAAGPWLAAIWLIMSKA